MGNIPGGAIGASQSKAWKRRWQMTTFTTEDRLEAEAIALKHQTQAQTKFGRLAYENFYRDVSNEMSCADSYGCTHGKELESPYLNDRNEPKK